MSHELSAILASMTPEERRTFATINAAAAAGVLTDEERRNLIRRVNDGAWVASLRVRMAATANRAIKSS